MQTQARYRPTVLVADDHEDTREMYALYLEHRGVDVIQAANGVDALDLAIERRPSAAVIDLWMPKLDGIELTRQLRLGASTSTTGIVIVTGALMANERGAAFAAGADAFLPKPVDLDALWNALLETVRLKSSVTGVISATAAAL